MRKIVSARPLSMENSPRGDRRLNLRDVKKQWVISHQDLPEHGVWQRGLARLELTRSCKVEMFHAACEHGSYKKTSLNLGLDHQGHLHCRWVNTRHQRGAWHGRRFGSRLSHWPREQEEKERESKKRR